jgi:hypothetical protein
MRTCFREASAWQGDAASDPANVRKASAIRRRTHPGAPAAAPEEENSHTIVSYSISLGCGVHLPTKTWPSQSSRVYSFSSLASHSSRAQTPPQAESWRRSFEEPGGIEHSMQSTSSEIMSGKHGVKVRGARVFV